MVRSCWVAGPPWRYLCRSLRHCTEAKTLVRPTAPCSRARTSPSRLQILGHSLQAVLRVSAQALGCDSSCCQDTPYSQSRVPWVCFVQAAQSISPTRAHRYTLLFLFPRLADEGLLAGGKIFPQAAMSPQSASFLVGDFRLLGRPETDTQAAAVTAGLNYYRCPWAAPAALHMQETGMLAQ